MRLVTVFRAVIASAVVIGMCQPAAAQAQGAGPLSIQEFRQLVIQMTTALDGGPNGSVAARKLREKIEQADAQVLELMYNGRADC